MPRTRLGGAFKLTTIFALEVGFIVVFHLLGNVHNMGIDFSNFKQWIDVTPPEVALVASIRLLALVFSYWLLTTSFIYMIARALHLTALLRGLELITLPGVRRAIDAGLAATIIGGTVFGGAGAVFAQTSHHAQAQGAPAAVTATHKDLRALYNPTPAGGSAVSETPSVTNPSTSTPTSTDVSGVVVQSPNETPAVSAPSSGGKVVVASTDTPAAQATTPVATPAVQMNQAPAETPTTTPVKDADGNYIPIPAGGGGTSTPQENTSTTKDTTTSTTTPSKVVVTEPTNTTPTTAKVVTPTTTPPVSVPPVSVEGKQVQQTNDVPSTPTTPTTTSTSYTVVSGDNFWAIAKAHVQANLGHEPTNAEVANYWVKLIDANKANIRSGDPDLIFPGEVFTLPAI